MGHKEDEFLFYRNKLDRYAHSLMNIHGAIERVSDCTIAIDPAIAFACQKYIYHHDRYTESFMQEEMAEWTQQGIVPLMNQYTLGMFSSDGYPNTECQNIESFLKRIEKYSAGNNWCVQKGGTISLSGFSYREVDWIISSIRTQTMDALENLRNISTCMKYLRKIKIQLNGVIQPSAIANTSWRGEFVFSWKWLKQVSNVYTANTITGELDDIVNRVSFDDLPDSLDFFSSNKNNRVPIDYSPE